MLSPESNTASDEAPQSDGGSSSDRRTRANKLLAQRLAEKRTANSLVPRPRTGGPLPLSFSQEQIWFASEIEPQNVSYIRPVSCRFEGVLDVPRLEHALNGVLKRHDVLRSSFDLVDGEPVQRIAPGLSLALTPLDAPGRDRSEQYRFVRETFRASAFTPFDLRKGPLVRADLFRIAPEEHLLLLAIHHAVFDGRSQEILLDELASAYDGNESPDDIKERFQYSDFVAWQRKSIHQDQFRSGLTYWKNQLRDLSRTKLRLGFPTIERESNPVHSFEIDAQLTTRLRSLGRDTDATLFMTLLTAFKLLLSRYTGNYDVAVGTPLSGRARPEFDDVIGCFTNTLTLRTDLTDRPDFRDCLRRVRDVTLKAFEHQDVPFEYIVRELGLPPEERRTAVPILFQLRNYQRRSVECKRIRIEPIDLQIDISPTDLAMEMRERGDVLVGKILYDGELFDADSISRMAEHYCNLLHSIADDPDLSITEHDYLGESEKNRLLVEWNSTSVPTTAPIGVAETIAERASLQPDAPAVSMHGDELTYGSLLERADALASMLREHGAGRESRVALVMPPSHDLIIGALAVLRAGATLVPIDPSYPRDRIQFMIEDADPQVVLTPSKDSLNLPLDTDILAADDWPAAASSMSLEPSRPCDAAYIIYTSGSTGKPKGVVIEHRSLSNLADWARAYYSIGSSDRILQFTSISFDPFMEDLVMALSAGACLVLRTDAMFGDAATFLRSCSDEKISVLNVPTAFWHEMVLGLDGSPFPACIHTVIIGGQAGDARILERWRSHVPERVRLVNEYGPTETTVVATCFECSSAAPSTSGIVPIGSPVDNTLVYVLDSEQRPVPIGVEGELYIGGDGVSRGYWRRPDLTSQRFVPDPFSTAPAARMYRTGDRVRWHPEGYLEFLGRVDRQIKLRGYRIEPEEIELTLTSLEAVSEASVIVRADGDEDQLAAYVVPVRGSLEADDIKAELTRRLPAYMIPSTITVLNGLPRLPNGKVDRTALPAPAAEGPKVGRALTDTECKLAEIWKQLLNLDSVRPDSGFFELGGHSLLGMRLLARISDEFGVRLTLGDLFTDQKLSSIADAIDRESTDEDLAELIDALGKLSEKEAARLLGSNQ